MGYVRYPLDTGVYIPTPLIGPVEFVDIITHADWLALGSYLYPTRFANTSMATRKKNSKKDEFIQKCHFYNKKTVKKMNSHRSTVGRRAACGRNFGLDPWTRLASDRRGKCYPCPRGLAAGKR